MKNTSYSPIELKVSKEIKTEGKSTTSATMKSIPEHFPSISTAKENLNFKHTKWIMAIDMPFYTGESRRITRVYGD
jgi:hypothetical protein